MARTKYQGYGITELRIWARDLGIKGRSKMTGDELVVACKAGARASAEQAVLTRFGGALPIGTVLRRISTGTTVRVTSNPAPYVQDGRNYESLCFTAEYVEVGDEELSGNWRNGADPGKRRARFLNEEAARTRAWNDANGYGDMGLRHMLYQYEVVNA